MIENDLSFYCHHFQKHLLDINRLPPYPKKEKNINARVCIPQTEIEWVGVDDTGKEDKHSNSAFTHKQQKVSSVCLVYWRKWSSDLSFFGVSGQQVGVQTYIKCVLCGVGFNMEC